MLDLEAEPAPNLSAGPRAGDLFDWRAAIIGPDDTPYQDGVFFLDIKFPQNYPFEPPKIRLTGLFYLIRTLFLEIN